MNNSEMKKLILGAIPKQILKLVVGYGINQKGACCRTGSLESFDHQFKTKSEAQTFEQETFQSGYGNTLRGAVEVTIWDEVEATINEEKNSINELNEEISEAEIFSFAKNTAQYFLQEIADKL